MSSSPRNMYMLIEGVLDEGLPYVAMYLEKNLAASLIITDYNGIIHFPEVSNDKLKMEERFITIPGEVKRKEYFFHEKGGILYYRVPYNGKNAYVIISQCRAETVFSSIAWLREAELAIKCYFTKINQNQDKFSKELEQYFFGSSTIHIIDILKMSEKEINPHEHYFALLVNEEYPQAQTDWQLIKAYFTEYLRNQGYDVIPVLNDSGLLMLIPTCFYSPERYSTNLTGINYIKHYKELIEAKFNLHASLGIGQGYAFINIRESFKEARIAITLPRLIGKDNFIQQFSDLGIYYSLFSQDSDKIMDYCLQRLEPLIENDYKTDGELLPTLRKLLDSCVNIKSTADSLFIHVNTLYYRINRIEQILQVDLSKMETRVELYTAIKVWDTLIATGYIHGLPGKELNMQPMYIGG